MKLDGQWELLPTPTFRGNYYSDDHWLTMDVPSHWQQHPQLESYAGKVVYRKRFELPKQKDKRYRLRLNGVFYFYIVYLNGFRLGENEGYFFPREFDITAHLKDHNLPNELLVEVECPDEKNKNAKRLITGVFSHWDCLDPATNPGGIWQSVEILESGPQYISEFRLSPVRRDDVIRLADENPPDQIEMRADLVVNSSAPSAPVYRATFTPYNFDGKPFSIAWRANAAPGDNTVQRFFTLENPKLWWTHDLLDPNLYTVRVETFGDELLRQRYDAWEFQWGLRTFELRDWIPFLNGHRMFLKGSNYPPGDTRIATMTRERYLQDFQLAKDANMNFMRIHAHVEKPECYAVADELGILLWQDFPLQWSYDHTVLPQAERQAALMARMLYNHPSIGIWCMHNEPVHIVDTKARSLPSLLEAGLSSYVYSWDRHVMDTRLKQIVAQLDETRPVIRASGKYALPWLSDTDSHFYFGWYKTFDGPKRRFETLKKIFPRSLQFVTEFGAQSFPNLESATKFMDADIAKIDWAHLADRYHFQPDMMADWHDWRGAKSLAELIALSQDYQIEINQYYIDWLRFHKYAPCGGIAPFMFHDSNPAVQWSVIDYWRVPKSSYYHLQVAFNPEYVFTLPAKDVYHVGEAITLPIYAVNDSLYHYDAAHIKVSFAHVANELISNITMSTALAPDCLAQHVQTISFRATQP
ncbi:MAG: sugar-binding domain-containing protein, partial [Chloroflexota bacterium]